MSRTLPPSRFTRLHRPRIDSLSTALYIHIKFNIDEAGTLTMGQIALAEQGTETIKLTDQDRKDLKTAKLHKTISGIFAAAATGISGTAAYFLGIHPQATVDFIGNGTAQPLADMALGTKALLFALTSMATTLSLSPIWISPQSKINEKLYDIWQRQNDAARATEQQKLDRAEKKFMHSLIGKS